MHSVAKTQVNRLQSANPYKNDKLMLQLHWKWYLTAPSTVYNFCRYIISRPEFPTTPLYTSSQSDFIFTRRSRFLRLASHLNTTTKVHIVIILWVELSFSLLWSWPTFNIVFVGGIRRNIPFGALQRYYFVEFASIEEKIWLEFNWTKHKLRKCKRECIIILYGGIHSN